MLTWYYLYFNTIFRYIPRVNVVTCPWTQVFSGQTLQSSQPHYDFANTQDSLSFSLPGCMDHWTIQGWRCISYWKSGLFPISSRHVRSQGAPPEFPIAQDFSSPMNDGGLLQCILGGGGCFHADCNFEGCQHFAAFSGCQHPKKTVSYADPHCPHLTQTNQT